ncbi:translation initiation factor eIF-2B subunit alpha, putative, partial [Eimeria maxima]
RLTTLPLSSACSLYQHFAVKHYERKPHLSVEELKSLLIAQSAKFASRITESKQTIAEIGRIMFTKDQMVVLTHGRSSCVERLLLNAWLNHKKRFIVIITQQETLNTHGQQTITNDEDRLLASLSACGIPASLSSVSLVASLMERVDLVVVGAEAVAENGGIINRVGTATVALVAAQRCIPFYVVCEACKFGRAISLDNKASSLFSMQPAQPQRDSLIGDCWEPLDYTCPEYINLLFTDLGVFTPCSVSDELAKLFN